MRTSEHPPAEKENALNETIAATAELGRWMPAVVMPEWMRKFLYVVDMFDKTSCGLWCFEMPQNKARSL